MDDYRQTLFLGQSRYLIVEDGVLVKSKRLAQSNKQLVPFETLEHNPEVVSSSSRWAFWTAVIFFLLSGVIIVDFFTSSQGEASAIVFYAAGAIVFGLIYIASRSTRLVFHSKHNRLVFKQPADDAELTDFVEKLQRAKIDYFRKKLENQKDIFDVNEQHRYLVGLRESGILDDGSVSELSALLKIEPRQRIGFV